MGRIIEKITETENLHWAWKKTKNSFLVGDIWYNEIELASFEANLYEELDQIKKEIRLGSYVMRSIKPLPFPKGYDKETGEQKVRQTFEISVRDQVAWMAVVNVIGESLDYRMPWWSYGHRLYVPVWKDINGQWDVGWYRHSKGLLYRKWNQSWPLFRRNISLTAKIMCYEKTKESFDIAELDEAERIVYNTNEFLSNQFKSKYLEKNYWGNRSSKKLHWATIDFSKFYPKVKRSVIVKNIIKYTKGVNDDCDFILLIDRMMNFQIDHSEWNDTELFDINLTEPEKFQGLPTGLFVAGFLANVALLSVDEKISTDLERNKDIAHFRFVDDHVILAYEFEKLEDWITKYNTYLTEAETGAEFNFDKIEPKSFSNIINPEWRKKYKKKIKEELTKAEKETSLDPAFPAPLMTQTLAKVSAINKSDFEFLSHTEEEQLISDLEHLLLTDFPDHELRKDTRVSFAASILSRIVPNTKDDYEEVYDCQKRIHHQIKEYQKEFEKTNKTFIVDKLHDLIFDDSIIISEYFAHWENQITNKEGGDEYNKRMIKVAYLKKEKETEQNLKSLNDELKKTQKNRVYKLLKKAISENPEKVRIWARVIDYCKKVSCCQVKEAYDKIEELSNISIHYLSASFLRTLFMNVLSDRIMQSIFAIVNKNTLSQKETFSAKSFLESVLNEGFLKDLFDKEYCDSKSYYQKTYEFYRFVLGSAIFILEESKFNFVFNTKIIEQYKLIDWKNSPQEWINNTYSPDINAWLYWILWKTHDKSNSIPLDFWIKFQPYIDYDKKTYKPLILSFPNYNYLPRKDSEFLTFILNEGFSEGWLFEVFKTGKNHISDELKASLKEKYPPLFRNIFNPIVNLWEFILWQQTSLDCTHLTEIDCFNRYFDPRFSEWTALELVRQIIVLSKVSGEAFFENKTQVSVFHPANFYLSTDLIDEKSNKTYNWYDWKEKIRTKNMFGVVEFASQISDESYTTKGLLESELKTGESSKVHALGIILLQLITHNTNLPWIWNSPDKSLIWENLFYKKVQNSPVSSFTLLILQGCFSSKNRETFLNSKLFNDLLKTDNTAKTDTTYDVPAINDVYTLEKYIVKSQRIIESYQLSMEDSVPRQLIPISLIQLSNQNNPFEDSNNDTIS